MKKLNSKIISEITHKTLHEFLLKESVFPTVTNIKAAINKIYNVVNKYGLNSKLYHDDYWQAIDDYRNAIESLGYDVDIWCENGGYGDYHETTHMPTSKTYKVRIDCGLPRKIEGYIKMCAAGSMEDHFSAYDTLMVVYPQVIEKSNSF